MAAAALITLALMVLPVPLSAIVPEDVWVAPSPTPLRRHFNTIDADGDGILTVVERKAYAARHYIDGEFAEKNLTTEANPYYNDRLAICASCGGLSGSDQCDWDEFLQHASVGARQHELSLMPMRASNAPAPAPEQVHLVFGDSPGTMRVVFVTQYTTAVRNADITSTVTVTEAWNASKSYSVHAQSHGYSVPDRWWQPHGWQGLVWQASVTDLVPSQRYTYMVNVTTPQGTTSSRIFHFTAAPDKSKKHYPVTFAAFGDMGTTMPFGFKVTDKMVLDHQNGHPLDFVFHHGDISYAGVDTAVPPLNITKDDEDEAIWDLFGHQIEPLASEVPWMTGVGNHEAWYNFTSFEARYPMPTPNDFPEARQNFWFAFDYGPVHIISGSSEAAFDVGSPQYQWVEQAFLNASTRRKNANDIDWIIFSLHRPLVCSDKSEFSDNNPTAPRFRTFTPLLQKYGVDLVLTGHMHCYERVHPLLPNGTVASLPEVGEGLVDRYINPIAPVHVVNGAAGAMQVESWISPSPAWSAIRIADGHKHGSHGDDGHGAESYEGSYGYGRIRVLNESALFYEFIPISPQWNLTDSFWIVKS